MSTLNRAINLTPFKRQASQGSRSEHVPDIVIGKLASAAGVNRSHLSRILNGRCKPGFETLLRLKDALGCSTVEQVSKWIERVRGGSKSE
jgi:transcriptional regulator with XRE-family HTH domain